MATWEPKSRSTSVASSSAGSRKFSPPGLTLSSPGYEAKFYFWIAMQKQYTEQYQYSRETNDWAFFGEHVKNAQFDRATSRLLENPGRQHTFHFDPDGSVAVDIVTIKPRKMVEEKTGGREKTTGTAPRARGTKGSANKETSRVAQKSKKSDHQASQTKDGMGHGTTSLGKEKGKGKGKATRDRKDSKAKTAREIGSEDHAEEIALVSGPTLPARAKDAPSVLAGLIIPIDSSFPQDNTRREPRHADKSPIAGPSTQKASEDTSSAEKKLTRQLPAPQQPTAVNARLDVTVLDSTRPTDYARSFGPVSGPSLVGAKKSSLDAALQSAISSKTVTANNDMPAPAHRQTALPAPSLSSTLSSQSATSKGLPAQNQRASDPVKRAPSLNPIPVPPPRASAAHRTSSSEKPSPHHLSDTLPAASPVHQRAASPASQSSNTPCYHPSQDGGIPKDELVDVESFWSFLRPALEKSEDITPEWVEDAHRYLQCDPLLWTSLRAVYDLPKADRKSIFTDACHHSFAALNAADGADALLWLQLALFGKILALNSVPDNRSG